MFLVFPPSIISFSIFLLLGIWFVSHFGLQEHLQHSVVVVLDLFFILGYIFRDGNTRSQNRFILTQFLKNTARLIHSVPTILYSYEKNGKFQSFSSISNLSCQYLLLYLASQCMVISHCVCTFFMINDVAYLIIFLLTILSFSFVKCPLFGPIWDQYLTSNY